MAQYTRTVEAEQYVPEVGQPDFKLVLVGGAVVKVDASDDWMINYYASTNTAEAVLSRPAFVAAGYTLLV